MAAAPLKNRIKNEDPTDRGVGREAMQREIKSLNYQVPKCNLRPQWFIILKVFINLNGSGAFEV